MSDLSLPDTLTLELVPSRAAALARMDAFLPRAGLFYVARRNHSLPGHRDVSCLSPYVRHRVLTEEELLCAVLQRHGPQAAEKFIQEVFWRTYWKGWLEMRPGVWADYRRGVAAAVDRVQTEAGLRRGWEEACAGRTGIEGFDDWARELVATGYMHNHARMWFASIWIFTLRLPWELGADFFLRHLLDGDAASNTLSWRWVAGLHTQGKTYLARADNIAAFTGGRFRPDGLAHTAPPLPPDTPARRVGLPSGDDLRPGPTQGLLLTEDDLSPGWLLDRGLAPVATAVVQATAGRSPLVVSPKVGKFVAALTNDMVEREGGRLGPVTAVSDARDIVSWARGAGLAEVVAPHVPVGPAADALVDLRDALAGSGVRLVRPVRDYDAAAWPHATHGFFRFRDAIPSLLEQVPGWRLI
jgi:deoxyribodipyrimidine photo-lyase